MMYDCEHQKFLVTETDIISAMKDGNRVYVAAITISCRKCGTTFKFNGPREDLNLEYPTVSLDELQIRLPIEPYSRSVLISSEPKDN